MLGEELSRLGLMGETRAYRAQAKRIQAAVRGVWIYLAYAPEVRARCRDKCWIRDYLPGHVARTAATRAFNAILQDAFGKGAPSSGVRIGTISEELCTCRHFAARGRPHQRRMLHH